MTANPTRDNRLRAIFQATVRGERDVGSNGPLFIEAITKQPEPHSCVTTIIGNSKGLSSISTALASVTSLSHLNGVAADFLLYLRHKDITIASNGQYLVSIIKAIIDSAVFWPAILNAFRSGELQEKGQLAFTFLLLQLLRLDSDPDNPDPYRPVAENSDIRKRLFNQTTEDGINLALDIENIVVTRAVAPVVEGPSPGGRHDNDFVNFRDIAILPTSEEILCKEPSFLRPSEALDDPNTADNRPALYLDSQFRLLREDMLHEMKEELQLVLSPDPAKKKRGGRGMVIENLALTDLYCGPQGKRTQWALCFKAMKDIPQLNSIKDTKKRHDFLTKDDRGKKILRHQSLTCLLADNEVLAFPVIHREETLLSQTPPTIVLRLSDKKAIMKTLVRAKTAKELRLIFIDTAIFSYEPVLKALQDMKSLPMSQELLFWSAKSNYPPRLELLDLASKIKANPQQDLQSLLNLNRRTQLDKAQSDSLIAGLSEPVALIQGPPGTGKSFIGALLAKCIHDHTTETILVVCYTNHALDQFLMDLIGTGIPFNNVVRIGGKFNPATEPMSLHNQKPSHSFSFADRSIIDNTKADAEVCARGLETAFNRYLAASVQLSNSELMDHLEFEDSDFFDAFQVPTDKDGMIVTGKKGKAVDTYYLLQQWVQGKDAGIFKSHPEVGRNPEKARVWAMPKAERQARINKWQGDILKYIVGEVYDMAKAYGRTQTELARKYGEKDINVLKSKRIIGCTTTGAAKYKEIIQAASPDVLLVEEAGEILESHVITALSEKTNQIILIGDHKQLRPKVNNYKLTFEKGEGYNLNVSLFERLVLKGYPHSILQAQHRMRPEISALIRHLTYPELKDSDRTKNRPSLRGVRDNIVFVNHAHPEDDNKQLADKRDMGAKSSKQNSFEVDMIMKIVRYLLQQSYKSEDIVILTPYLAQLYLLRGALRNALDTDVIFSDLDYQDLVRAGVVPNTGQNNDKKKAKIRISTIDNYQGEESEIVVASLCRSNSDNDIGFMFSPERLNVLLSRARDSLIVVGNLHTFTNARKGKALWSNLVKKLKEGNHVYDGFPVVCQRHPSRQSTLKEANDFAVQCPDGGCDQVCGQKLSCGIHGCERKCHATATSHDKITCEKLVPETCALGHKRHRKCSEPPSPFCKKCAHEAEIAEAERRRQHELQEEREKQKLAHEKRMKDLEALIAAEQNKIADKELAAQRETALRQKRADLDATKARAANYRPTTTFNPTTTPYPNISNSQPSQQSTSIPPASSNAASSSSGSYIKGPTSNATQPPQSRSSSPSPASAAPRPQTPPGNPATMNKSSPEAEWQRQKDVEGANSAAIDAIMAMTGLEEVKRQILRIKDKVDITKRQNTSISDERFNVVFLGNPGTGKTTVARQYAKFLTSNQIVSGPAFLETTGARLVYEGVAGMEKLINDAVKVGGGVIFIDEAYQLTGSGSNPQQSGSQQGSQVLDFMLAEMENRTGQIVFVLAGYAKQMEKFFEHNPGLPSRVPYTLKFTDYTDAELRLMLERRIIKKYSGQMKIEDGLQGLYMRIAVRRLGRGRGREGFGNARALQNMFDKISERQAERVQRERRAGQNSDDFLLTKDDIIGPDPSKAILKSAAWVELQALTGLRSVKESVRSMMDMISVNYARELQEKEPLQMSLNRVFLGSPGTGKTTVGKLYGRILADIGLLSNGEVVVKNPADFKGAYIGQSEKNTKQILDSTIGKVLIIDEAYMLYGGGGSSNHTDIYNTAIIDTIVAEVQSVPGEDRCILLLGYEDKMREMFQNVNEGFSRRFAIEDAFKFEDFTEPELRDIMEGKLKKQDLLATDHAKQVALEVLAREKTRPNFGNGGAVENLLSASKARYLTRIRGITPRPLEVKLEPHDFDPEWDRHLRSDQNLDKLFEDVVGSEEVVKKLREYQKVARVKKARNEDPRDVIPTNFVFKGPPGTGKTTTARKIGQVYYDMGFLASTEVIECSASDLVGQYVGHTGPKTKKLFEKALGKVLFIDEAYRLGQGHFAQEAVDEIVGLVTQETFKGKLIIILAGYDADMDQLMSINSGLNSRFPEVVYFRNFKPPALLEILDKKLRKDKVVLDDLSNPGSQGYSVMISAVEDLSALPGWGNAREIETLAKRMVNHVLKNSTDDATAQPAGFTLQSHEAVQVMMDMLDEMRSRSGLPRQSRPSYNLPTATSTSAPPPPPQASTTSSSAPPASPPPASSPPPPPPPTPPPPSSPAPPPPSTAPPPKPKTPPPQNPVASSSKQKASSPPPKGKNSAKNQPRSAAPSSGPQRDPSVSDDIWNQLQVDIQAAAAAAKKAQREIADAKRKKDQAEKAEIAKAQALQAALKAEKEARDAAAAQELKKKREIAEREQRAAEARLKVLADALKTKRELEQKKKQEEQRRQQKLRSMGVCPQGYPWHPQAGGYRCGGGSHFVSAAQLGI